MSYLNTKPLIYGLNNEEIVDKIDIVSDYPAKIAQMLLDDSIDIGLVPVAIISQLNNPTIITDFCIGCDGPVQSVAIFAEQPLEKLTTILLDYQSRTSVMLAKILAKYYWKLNINWVDTKGEDYIHQIKGTVGGLVIGDRAFKQLKVSPYIYDLGEAWKNYTHLPFVFAAWVSNKAISKTFIDQFNAAIGLGLNHLAQIVQDNFYADVDLMNYYTQYISYSLDNDKRKGLALFLELVNDEMKS